MAEALFSTILEAKERVLRAEVGVKAKAVAEVEVEAEAEAEAEMVGGKEGSGIGPEVCPPGNRAFLEGDRGAESGLVEVEVEGSEDENPKDAAVATMVGEEGIHDREN